MSTASRGPAVEADGLRRAFSAERRPDVVALAEVALTVARNEVDGLLGPDGAGKTTLVKILSTILLRAENKCCSGSTAPAPRTRDDGDAT